MELHLWTVVIKPLLQMNKSVGCIGWHFMYYHGYSIYRHKTLIVITAKSKIPVLINTQYHCDSWEHCAVIQMAWWQVRFSGWRKCRNRCVFLFCISCFWLPGSQYIHSHNPYNDSLNCRIVPHPAVQHLYMEGRLY